jgi:hypothetical protein
VATFVPSLVSLSFMFHCPELILTPSAMESSVFVFVYAASMSMTCCRRGALPEP